MNENSRIYLFGLAGGYLVYLGIQQFLAVFRQEASLPWLNVLAGLLFVAVGGLVALREWKAHKALTAKSKEDAEETEEAEGEEEE